MARTGLTSTTDGAITRLAALSSAALGGLDTGGVAAGLDDVRRVRGWIDSVEASLTRRAAVLHDTADAAPASDTVSRCGGVSAAEARRRERRSKALDDAPSFDDALADGAVTSEHVDALANATSKLDDDVRSQLFDHESDLLADATRMPPDRFGRSVRDLARHLERAAGVERNRRQRRDTFLSRKHDAATGMVEGRFAFHPELAEQIFGPIDREIAAMVAEGEQSGDPEYAGRRPDRNRLAAEALGRLVAGGHQQQRPIEADIAVIVDADTLLGVADDGTCETASGVPLPAASVRRLVCNGRVTPIIVDQAGVVIDAGRTIRHANRHQRRALRSMYRTCAIDTCDMPFDRCDMHHLVTWEQGGATDLRNLIPLCSHHHHTVHDRGWRLELDAERLLRVTESDGTTRTMPPDLADDRRRHAARRRSGRTAAA